MMLPSELDQSARRAALYRQLQVKDAMSLSARRAADVGMLAASND